jgi:pilus assembly protein Flp/PilA
MSLLSLKLELNSLILTVTQACAASLRSRVLVKAHDNKSLGPRSDSTWIDRELTMKALVSRFLKDESGATAIEYGLVAAGISVAIVAVVHGIGSKLTITFHLAHRIGGIDIPR